MIATTIETGKTYKTVAGFLFTVERVENGFAFDTAGYPCPTDRLMVLR